MIRKIESFTTPALYGKRYEINKYEVTVSLVAEQDPILTQIRFTAPVFLRRDPVIYPDIKYYRGTMDLNLTFVNDLGISIPEKSSKLKAGIDAAEAAAKEFQEHSSEILDLTEEKAMWEKEYVNHP